jgi:glutathione synthase/RimK-type ligase-like ATP-grasp enzyme
MHIAFVTYRDKPDFAPDDQYLVQYLQKKNITIAPVVWDDPEADWLAWDAVIIRSTWDYYKRPVEFSAWLKRIEGSGCKIFNPTSVMRWNMNKKYFIRFSEEGILLPSFEFLSQNTSVQLNQLMNKKQWKKAVVKPAISAGSFNTWVTTSESAVADQPTISSQITNGDIIVQKFMDEILTDGEISLLFFNKEFSHAVRKNAKPGDFRIQTQFGGTVTPITPDAKVLRQATDIVGRIKEPLLYARVDGIESQGNFYLMELELIEPVLYVNNNDQACENFYRALISMTR